MQVSAACVQWAQVYGLEQKMDPSWFGMRLLKPCSVRIRLIQTESAVWSVWEATSGVAQATGPLWRMTRTASMCFTA